MDWKARRDSASQYKAETDSANVSSYSKGAATTASDRIILHMDLDSFYAQTVCNLFPELHERPVGIKQKNIVVTCNYLARQRGVSKLQYLEDAFKACPELVLVSGENLLQFRRASAAVYRVTQAMVGPQITIERLGMDELFLDVTSLLLSEGSQPCVAAPLSGGPAPLARPLLDWSMNAEQRKDWCGHIVCLGAASIWTPQGDPPCSSPSAVLSAHVGTRAAEPAGNTPQYAFTQLQPAGDVPHEPSTPVACGSDCVQSELPSGCAKQDYAPCAGTCRCMKRLDPRSQHVQQVLQGLRRASWLLAALRCKLREELGITASGGVGTSKLAAKLASSVRKPNGQATILPWSLPEFMKDTPLRSVPGVGYALRQRLKAKRMFFVHDVRAFPRASLQSELGDEAGAFLHGVCWGQDITPVRQQVPAKSVSCEDAFQQSSSVSDALRRLRSIVRSWLLLLDEDATQHNRRPAVLRLSWRHAGKARQSKQAAFPDTVPLGSAASAVPPEQYWRGIMQGNAQRSVENAPKDERGALLLNCGGATQVDDSDARLDPLMRALGEMLHSALGAATPRTAPAVDELHLTLLGVAASAFTPLASRRAGSSHSLDLRSMLATQPAHAASSATGRVLSSPAAGAVSGVGTRNTALQPRADSPEHPAACAPPQRMGGAKRQREHSQHSDADEVRRPAGVTPEAWGRLPPSVQQAVAAAAPRP